MITIFNSLLVAAIVAAVTWIYNQSQKITRLEATNDKLEAMSKEHSSELGALKTKMYNIDARIDTRVGESTQEFTKILHQLQLTLKELNITVTFLREEVKDLKDRK